jgi:hypothetical protein
MEIGVYVSVANINLGVFYGNLKDGVKVNMNLDGSKGNVRFYLKYGNEVWTGVDVSGFHSHLERDLKLMTL